MNDGMLGNAANYLFKCIAKKYTEKTKDQNLICSCPGKPQMAFGKQGTWVSHVQIEIQALLINFILLCL